MDQEVALELKELGLQNEKIVLTTFQSLGVYKEQKIYDIFSPVALEDATMKNKVGHEVYSKTDMNEFIVNKENNHISNINVAYRTKAFRNSLNTQLNTNDIIQRYFSTSKLEGDTSFNKLLQNDDDDYNKNNNSMENYSHKDSEISKNSINSENEKPAQQINAEKESDITDEFFLQMKDKVEIAQARGKMYDVFLSRDEANVEFNFYFFLKYFIYHFLFFFTLGPIISLLIIPIEGYNMVKNMGFIGCTPGFITQTFFFLAGGPNILLTIYFKYVYIHEDKLGGLLENLEISEMIFCVLALFIRILIISFRYGYTSESSLATRYLPVIPKIYRDYIITGWRQVDCETIDIEIFNSIVRLQIDADLFLYNVISNLEKSWIERFSDDDFHENKSSNDLNNLFRVENINLIENKLKEASRKNLINYREFTKIKPFFSKIKREKKINSVKKPEVKNIVPKTIFNNKGESTSDNILNEMPTSHETETYKKLIKKISMSFKKNLFEKEFFFDKSKTFGVDPSLLPNFYQQVSLKLLNFDFPGRIYMRELFLCSKFESKNTFTYIISLLILLHTFIPHFYRGLNNKPSFGNSFLEIILIVLNLLSTILIFLISVIFIEIGGNDYARRKFCLKALSAMISPDKYLIKVPFKLFPTINFFNHQSLKSWLFLRLLTMDVGMRYVKRIELYCSSFLFTYLIIVLVLVLGIFDVIKKFSFKDYPVFFLMGFTEAFIVILVLYRMALVGVNLNEFYDKHKCELTYIKTNFKYVILNWKVWKDMDSYVNNYLQAAKEMYCMCMEYHRQTPSHIIEEDKIFGKEIPSNDEEFKENLKCIVESLDDTIERLELEHIVRPVKLLGITLTSDLMMQFYAMVFTLLFSLIQYVISLNA